ncbi:MAG: RNA 2',3'-cyclic phosphodiesterase [Chloroflexi bacterium]|nr:RNA 2',3'-cyclic phosphodiesterase [Chloroflexota bacterium]
MERLRAFIAVELPPGVTETLHRLVQDLQALALREVRWVRPEGVHLTLKFLGSIPADSVEPVSQAMGRCVASATPFDLSLRDLGAFPSLRDPRVVWVGLGGDLEPLLSLHAALESELEGLGFERERRPFNPHLTLGRMREGTPTPQRRRVGEALARVPGEVEGELPVREVNLIRSTLTPSGATYASLYSVALGGAP